jgi:hypothetical protein
MESCGTIAPGGDKHGYLGHYRSPEVLKRGHNVGAPSGIPSSLGGGVGPTINTPNRGGSGMGPKRFQEPSNVMGQGAAVAPQFDATVNPIAATKQQNRANLAAAKLAGGGALKGARMQAKANMREAKTVRKARDMEGMHAADMATLKTAKRTARQASVPKMTQVADGMNKGGMTPKGPPKAALGSAVAGLRAARQGLRGIMRGNKMPARQTM